MHSEFCNRVGAYRDGELPAAERQAFEAHLGACDECRQELSRLERLGRFISAAALPPGRRLLFNINQVRMGRQSLLRLAEVLMAAASLVLVACGFALYNSGAQTEPAVVANWERVAFSQQLEAPPATEVEDPIAQVLLRE